MTESSKKGVRVRTGRYFETGNFAVVEGAMASGVTTFYGYPITPSSEILELIAERLIEPGIDGSFFQLEDEIASITACIGSSWAGAKTLTATSGPGFSLMQEGLGLASFTETPIVVANSMRWGPSTGNPTLPAQGDLMQCRFGSHGDYLNVTIAPSSVQECFDFTIEAFRISELLRTPVILLLDQVLSSMHEDFIIPKEEEIPNVYRALPNQDTLPYVNPMPIFGHGYRGFSTGLSHSVEGTPDLRLEIHSSLIDRLFTKLISNEHLLPPIQVITTDNVALQECDAVILAYGSTVRSVLGAIRKGKREKLSIGLIKLSTLWPFPEKKLRSITRDIPTPLIVADMAKDQLLWPVRRYLPELSSESLNYMMGAPIPPSLIIKAVHQRVKGVCV